jgi:hypothetical protein
MKTPESFNKPEAIVELKSFENKIEHHARETKSELSNLEKDRKNRESEARFEALELAQSKAEQPDANEKSNMTPNNKIHLNKSLSFKKTMTDIRYEMTESQRLVSKIIHNERIEKASELAEKTIFRPYPVLFGGIFAFVFSLSVYIIAKNIGFELSGFETFLGFILGWIFGLIVDYFRLLILGNSK